MDLKGTQLQSLWEENKRFLLIAGSGLAVFLLLRSCVVVPFAARAEKTDDRNIRLTDQVRGLYSEVRKGFEKARARHEALGDLEDELLGRYSLVLPGEALRPRDGSAREVHLTHQIEKIWGDVYRKARERNCELPQKISTRDLGVRPDSTEAELAHFIRQLEVLRRALEVLVDAGVRKIGPLRLHPTADFFIRENPDHRWLLERIDISVEGSYESLADTLRECQKPGRTLQVLLADVAPGKTGDPGLLKARLEFAGFHIEEVVPEEEEP